MPGKKGRKSAKKTGSRSNKYYTEKKRARQRKQRESGVIDPHIILTSLFAPINLSNRTTTKGFEEEAAAGSSVPIKSDTKKQDYDNNQNPNGDEKKSKMHQPQKPNFKDEASAGLSSTAAETSDNRQSSDSEDDRDLFYCSGPNSSVWYTAGRTRRFMTGTRANAGRAGHGQHGHGRPVIIARRGSYSLNSGTRYGVQYRYIRKFYQTQKRTAPAPQNPQDLENDEEVYPLINDNEHL